MAKAKITGKIPGIDGEIEVTGNLATEDAIKDLIKAVEALESSQKIETKDVQDGLDDAVESLEDFDDEVIRATKSQSKLSRQVQDLTKETAAASAGFIKTTANTDSMADMVESAGNVLAGFAGGVAGMIPLVGEGTARLAEATVVAGTALLSMAVGAVESFQAMNRSIMDGGLLLQGGFSGLADAADVAGLPINQFGEAVMANINRLRLLDGGAPGGLRRLSQGFKVLQEANEENLDTLYALGFSTQDVVSGMTDVAIGAQRAGRNLNNEELAAGTFDYLKNLRELNRLTGENADSIQEQVQQNRSNLYIQRNLRGLGDEQRTAANTFIAAMERAGAGGLALFALTGRVEDAEQALAVEQNRAFANIMRQYIVDLQSGMDPEAAMARYRGSLAANQELIDAQARVNEDLFGQAQSTSETYRDIGTLTQLALEQVRAAVSGEDPLGGTTDPDTGEDTGRNLSITMGALQGATNDAKTAIQSTFVEGLDRLSGDTGLMTSFAESISGAAMGAEAFRDAIFAAMEGDFEAAAEALRLNGPDGYRQDERTLGTEQYRDPLELIDPNYIPMADGGILSGPESGFPAELHGTEAVVPLPDGRSIPVDLNLANRGGMQNLSFESLARQLDQISVIMQNNNVLTEENEPITIEDFSTSLDSSRTLGEMLQVNKNMLNQMMNSVQKTDQLIRAMENANLIARNTAYTRA